MQSKSRDSYDSAVLLSQSEAGYCMAVQCAYYSCLQLIMDLLTLKFYCPPEDLRDKFSDLKKDGKTTAAGTHEFFITEAKKMMKKNDGWEAARQLYDSLTELKDHRVEAAYHAKQLDGQTVRKILAKSRSVNESLRETINKTYDSLQ